MPSTTPTLTTARTKKLLLLVDDDREILEATGLRLQASGYDTTAAYDGEQAVHEAVAKRPDGIVLDVRMPRADGLEALRTLRQRDDTKHIPVVMLSASILDRRNALDAGARFFITKPYEKDDLLKAIQTALEESEGTIPCNAE